MIRRLGQAGRAAGFTLVELLLALTLMSMLLALAYGGLRAATRATDRGQTVLEDGSRIRMAHQFVHRQLNQLLPLAFAGSRDGSERTVFVGEAQRIRYVAPMPGYLGFGGPQVQELSIVPGENGLELVLSHALLQDFEEERLNDRLPIPLLGDIESAGFSFLGEDENGELTGWLPAWEDGTILPNSIALDVEFREEVYIRWPLLTASVRVDESAVGDLAPEPDVHDDYRDRIRNMIRGRREKQ